MHRDAQDSRSQPFAPPRARERGWEQRAGEKRCAGDWGAALSPFAIEYILHAGLGDDGVVAFEPLVLVLADEAGVVAALQRALVVDHRKQGIPTHKGGGSLLHFLPKAALFNAVVRQ